MPMELTALMVKSGSDQQRPFTEAFYLSGSTVATKQILDTIEAEHPFSISDNRDGGILSPKQAHSVLSSWLKQSADPKGSVPLGQQGIEDLPYMVDLAKAGHSLVLMIE